jgi:hypothetical protein
MLKGARKEVIGSTQLYTIDSGSLGERIQTWSYLNVRSGKNEERSTTLA